jgi:NAD(P)-dependent dehydrogenase (short-subunit alcohol dehydrogenase family)
MQQALPLMEGHGGYVVFISSLGSRFALPDYPLGSMKAALECLVKHWAEELAGRRISVNGVTAGLLKTDSLKVLRQYWPGVAQLPDEFFVELNEVADVVLFLCSNAARVSGPMLVVITAEQQPLRFSHVASSAG